MPNERKPDDVQTATPPRRPPDEMDRRILGALATNAEVSYADLGQQVGLSPPAVHERVKRLKASGRLIGTVALIDGALMGKPLLAFIHVETSDWGGTPDLMALADFPEVEEIHSVTGDTCMLIKARLASSQALEGLLSRIYDIPSVRSTRTYVVLSTYLERPTQAGISADLKAPGIRMPTRRTGAGPA